MKEIKKERLSSIVRDTIAQFFKEELDLPVGCIVSISKVMLSKRATDALLYISVYPEKFGKGVEKRAKMLENKAVRYIKSHLALKHTLQIRFELDLGEQAREHIEKILNSS
ncbi:MAG: hypothetical protein A3C80_02930 [Candidatus Ryanbacteria bacterium RIFCSPHIGHO2_02_FULL_45_43]|uniref:Ribosome-binding factor A n=1 Tax=Candidatus Ryanbacteria bacterium RIFCSPHIGHO2_01_45_13 TaxID=1802112 RepID=A0A1G2FUK1_9BACT|nr:MAG: hypothetical protein A2W41_01020 [Candidatus Ryanbacteria bacterium RIFCSPHIGHO2_01_45_13]OGZ41769.1 MAG: hypothetical protein A2718_00445 [Candidatus Ryanbacteria bacterium RIFCSPHIGHO2_01_FULL_44_130]OGZ48064.1 MAG: hypothetical protein A3C80_02930 [Candidatus Ryanbacteria bacterium RIFCSPHIGHO2_02_FULL_45_43]OGZ50196.1 MAG: hypothetical protein A3E55_01545 [Candidatus Ryanbacteria bacterium RIFCSPHIGHO2_12_FULL_44_20]OGZ51070.1 MAG: hypothetical protein A3A17_02360 [Candidatus Ryanba